MSNSSLVSVKVPANSSNYTVGRDGRKIEYIAIHHMAGVLTAKQCGAIFQKAGRGGSSHYGIGKDGEVGQYVDEANTAWCNSNWDSNCKSVTIETSNSEAGGDWKVSDTVLNKLIQLVADIAKRNNLGTLIKGKNLVWHSMYTATTCPGAYLLSKLDYIIEEANKLNRQASTTTSSTSSSTLKHKVGETVNYNKIYSSSTSTEALNPLNTSGKITKVYEGTRNPYLIGNGTGFINDDCIASSTSTSTTSTTIKVGDKVKVLKNIQYTGETFAKYYDSYDVIEVSGDRVVIGRGSTVTCAINIKNIQKV